MTAFATAAQFGADSIEDRLLGFDKALQVILILHTFLLETQRWHRPEIFMWRGPARDSIAQALANPSLV
ncbi:hypothetical protein [Collimonas arenae]|uniref:hypothetical protein n=1 Tax=Collimonas arenae TaxID=279058 RepID=UPI0007785E3C|nr:hypothetical protein [Collimonas arenae]